MEIKQTMKKNEYAMFALRDVPDLLCFANGVGVALVHTLAIYIYIYIYVHMYI